MSKENVSNTTKLKQLHNYLWGRPQIKNTNPNLFKIIEAIVITGTGED